MADRIGDLMENNELSFHLEIYDGPLDVLLSLITKNKLNIYDIPITLIFTQYMEYIEAMQRMDMNVAGEFLEMASRLMLIKSRMLLPRVTGTDEEDDPRKPLVDALVEYRRAKEAAGHLAPLYSRYSGRFVKETDDVSPDRSFTANHDAALLIKAFERIFLRQQQADEARTDVPRQTLATILTKRIVPVPEKAFTILRYLWRHGETAFEPLLLATNRDRSELIASFLALLQLVRSGRMTVREDEDGEIYVTIAPREHSIAAADEALQPS
jgi:segregation and condensation protein A